MSDEKFEPKIVGFLCNWCSYRAADLAGTARIAYAPNVRIIRVMCSGRVDPTFVLKALSLGADGVMIAGCHPGECHYLEQNYKAMRRFNMLQHTLQAMGVEEQRVQLVWASAAEGQQLAEAIDKLVADIKAAGPARLVPELGREWRANRRRCRTSSTNTTRRWRYPNEHDSQHCRPARQEAPPKGKLAIYWAASCGGCEISILGIDTKILDVADGLRYRLLSLYRRRQGPRRRKDGMTARSTSACSTAACVPANRNTWHSCCGASRKCWWRSAPVPAKAAFPGWPTCTPARRSSTTLTRKPSSTDNPRHRGRKPETEVDEGTLHLPVFYDTLKTLDQTVHVDYYLPGCPPEVGSDLGGHRGDRDRQVASGRVGDRCQHDRLRHLPPHANRKEDQEVQADLGDHSGSGYLPAGTGYHLLRYRHAGRMRLSLPAGQLALHRLLRPQRRRGGLRRPVDERLGFGDRFGRSARRLTRLFARASPIRWVRSIDSAWREVLCVAASDPRLATAMGSKRGTAEAS